MSRNLGFEQARNLEESDNDRQILNNLGGGNIQLDIALFRNNLRNVSELTWQFNTQGSVVSDNKFIFPRSVLFVYTNGDEVQVTGSVFDTAGEAIRDDSLPIGNLSREVTYYVVDLELNVGTQRNQSAFGLATTPGGARISLGSIANNLMFIRNDGVSQENLLNIATPDILDSNVGLEGDSFTYNIGDTFTEGFDTIEESIGLFNFLQREKYVANDSVSTSRRIVIEGSSVVSDPAGFNSSETNLEQDNSPGVYITNPFSNVLNIERTRAYSTDSQPWNSINSALTTKSTQVNIGDLFFSDGIEFDSIDDVNTGESGLASSFTHKIPVLIDGVEYFVLLKSQ